MLRILPACLLLGAVAGAQTRLTLPAEFERHYGLTSSAALAGDSTRTQIVFATPFVAGTQILGVGLRSTGTITNRVGFSADVDVQMSSTTTAPPALSSTFASNEGSDLVVAFPRQIVNIPAMPANRSTGAFAEFPFTAPFVFGSNGSPNIVVDLRVYGRSPGAEWETDRAFAMPGLGRAVTHGIGCGAGTIASSSVGLYTAGTTMTIALVGAAPSSGAWLFPSFNLRDVGGMPLPLGLSIIGAGIGCDLLVDPLLGGVPFTTDVAGGASIAVPIAPSTPDIRTGWQWLYQVPPTAGNPLGLESTAVRAIRVGGEIVGPQARYVWNLLSATASTGSASLDAVPIVEFMVP